MSQSIDGELDVQAGGGLRRILKARHVSMIAIGGAIGTGLFLASGATIAQAGPGGALLVYAVVGVMVYFLMTSLGELATAMPVSGSFSIYGAKYVDEGYGFALGWNYWYNWAITVAVDLVAAQLVMAYWFPDVPGWIWSAGFLTITFLLNALSARAFGEAEYWFALIKVVTVVVFIITGVLMLMGIIAGGETGGWQNWTLGDAPFSGGFAALVGVTMMVGFAFQGTELVGVAAGESENPRRTIPRAIRQVFWRILLFYILAILVIGLLIPYTDPRLLRSGVTDISVSPFALIFDQAGLLGAAAVMNAVVLTAVLSAGNSAMYASTRMLWSLAREGKAPRLFLRVTSRGVPLVALVATTVVAAMCFLTFLYSPQVVYIWLLNAAGITGFISWLGIAVSHYRFRKGYVAQGHSLAALPYVSPYFPFGPLFAFIVCLFITLGQNYQAFLQDQIDWGGVIATYVGIPLFLTFWLGYRLLRGGGIVQYHEMTFPILRREGYKTPL
jgi:lysine-specific permease